MTFAEELKNSVLDGYKINREDCEKLAREDLSDLCRNADEIRKHFCEDKIDFCGIANGKSGDCSEDCKFCAQSKHHKTEIAEYALRENSELIKEACSNAKSGINRFGIVTSGKRLTSGEFEQIRDCYAVLKNNIGIGLCASHGLLSFEQLAELKKSGVQRYHCNIETSRRFFPHICSTHTFDDKINTIKAAQKAGLEVCSGVIIGMGEEFADRIDMVLELRSLGVKSVPVNVLNPIKGTPFEDREILPYDEVLLTIAVLRYVLPDAFIRLAGGRGNLADGGKSAFLSGANAAISGNMLTTAGLSAEIDAKIVESLNRK